MSSADNGDWKPRVVRAGQELAVSGVAAALSHVIHHPLYMLKSQMMYYGPKFSFRDFVEQSRRQHVRFLYRGLVPRTIGIMPEKAFKMQGWNIVGRHTDMFEHPTVLKWILAGSAAGAATTIIGCPSERVMVLAHIRKQGFWKVVKTTGAKGLYFGWTATLYRDITFNAIMLTTREIAIREWTKHYESKPDPWSRTFLGLIPGTLASAAACPYDVVKTRMQGDELGGVYRSCYRITMDIIKYEGARHLMKGLLPRLIVVPSMMSVFFVINEELEKLFHVGRYRPNPSNS